MPDCMAAEGALPDNLEDGNKTISIVHWNRGTARLAHYLRMPSVSFRELGSGLILCASVIGNCLLQKIE